VPSKQIGAGNFVIGNTYIRPRVSASSIAPVSFTRQQSVNFWMQVYNLSVDEKTHQNNGTIEYTIVSLESGKDVLHLTETTAKISPNSDQVTLEKSMPLASLKPGKYQVRIKVSDVNTKQEIAQKADFVVE